jgi:hemolysin III
LEIKDIKSSFKKEKRGIKSAYKKTKRNNRAEYKYRMDELKTQHIEDVALNYTSRGKQAPQNPPKRHLLEEIGNAVSHGLGSLFAVVAIIFMATHAEDVYETVGAWVYFFGLFVMFTMSCLYHAFPHGSRVKRLFRRFDYSSIYLLIGATFAPILLSYVGGVFGLVFFIIQWAVIITGITLVSVFGPTRLKFIHFPLYILLGWCGIMFLPHMLKGDPWFAFYILGGGVIYSLGIIPFAMKNRVAHFVWHFFVLAGALMQWVGVYSYIYLK